jgi:hypothetical protein
MYNFPFEVCHTNLIVLGLITVMIRRKKNALYDVSKYAAFQAACLFPSFGSRHLFSNISRNRLESVSFIYGEGRSFIFIF